MNLIPCGETCRFQQDGYCQLPPQPKASNAGQEHHIKCIYYQPLSTQDTDGLRNP